MKTAVSPEKQKIDVQYDHGYIVIHDLLLDRKMAITLEQARELTVAMGFLLEDMSRFPESYDIDRELE